MWYRLQSFNISITIGPALKNNCKKAAFHPESGLKNILQILLISISATHIDHYVLYQGNYSG
jgi:hypothetical protein